MKEQCIGTKIDFFGFNGLFSNMEYKKAIASFKSKKILIIGDIILDRYIYGKVNKISPEAPVPIVEVSDERFLLGGSANVAHNIASLGGKPSIAGVVGDDTAGKVLSNILQESRINFEGIVKDNRPTTVKTRIIAHNQQVVRFDKEEKKRVEGMALKAMFDYIKRAMADADAVIISDYKKGVVSSRLVKSVVRLAKQKGTFIAVDPKVGHFHFYKNVSLITPNIIEASQGSGVEIKDEKSLINAGKTLLKRLSCRSVLITRGEDGMSLFEKDKVKGIRVTHIPTAAKKVFDVTGAGDTVIAAFTLAYTSGCAAVDAAVMANHAAGIVVGEVGTAVTTPDMLLASLKGV
ncbi:MAG: D-glycero-beta-D-manno-heptose-7-phosphate kinase [Nitrospirae bacterium]|nr:D-glycero-beta-D-manno-heptose-7-phosphate kinase [Nitrospirota bacterium]